MRGTRFVRSLGRYYCTDHTRALLAPGESEGWNILNLGAILLARDLDQFELSRKAVRFVAYDGNGRTATVTHRKDFPAGYGLVSTS